MDQPIAVRHALSELFLTEAKERKLRAKSDGNCQITLKFAFGVATVDFRAEEVYLTVDDGDGYFDATIDYADPEMFKTIRQAILAAEEELCAT